MNELTFTIGALCVLFFAAMAILTPIFVLIICGHCEKMRKTLEKMEDMMRNGK